MSESAKSKELNKGQETKKNSFEEHINDTQNEENVQSPELETVEGNVTADDSNDNKTNKEQSQNQTDNDYKAIIDDLNDKVLRTAAELQNVKRRAQQDVQKARDYSIESFAKEMLSVMDNLDRAANCVPKETVEQNENLKNIIEGVEITKKEMVNVFERNMIKCINPKDEKFDHNFHQAISQVEDKEKESGTIIDVMQTGYTIKDRLLRPAMVVVVK